MELFQLLSTKISCDGIARLEIDRLFTRREYSKGEQLLTVDNLSRKLFFMESGLGRSFYFKDQKDITHLFFGENKFNIPLHNIFYGTPSPYAFELLEDSIVRIADYSEIEQYLDKSIALQKFSNMLLLDLLKASSDKIFMTQFQSASERYDSLLTMYPDILLKAPLGHIASYLGITQQTLSVIRAGHKVK